MVYILLGLALLVLAVFLTGGVYSPVVIVIAVALLIGYVIVRRAHRRRGSAAKL